MAYTSKYATGAAVDEALDKAVAALPATGTAADSDKLGGVAASGYQLETSGLTAETAIADGDYFPFYDTSATANRKTLWSNIKSVLKTYFDTLYQAPISVATTSETAYTISTAADRTEYRCSNALTSLTISAVPSGFFSCVIKFYVGSGFTAPTLPTGYAWAGGVVPTFTVGNGIQLFLDEMGATAVSFSTPA